MKKPAEFPLAGASGPAAAAMAATGSRGVELQGDSPELIAFVLLKNMVQIEQSRHNDVVFDKDWLLDTYAECLAAVQGRRVAEKPARPAKPAPRRPARSR